ncbi:hypothetical protein A6E11_06675 [Aliivibrio fischeri]|nr:hypothetical protein A6E10_15225 [Aliivibrio fischeri]OCH11286.1 hypothetical protein A6E11_06675 [Aliivibrio fischeri]OCH12631.1 hypothetical protein A6E09_08575 [Aliivibrio fischeri]OCH33475.1 hypothetical protein A6E13_00330 [Aliivibrio fischeri]OCH38527.1 hypothetical protein A6D99_10735 [Aliivibrio fischeri]
MYHLKSYQNLLTLKLVSVENITLSFGAMTETLWAHQQPSTTEQKSKPRYLQIHASYLLREIMVIRGGDI